ncbi:MAG: ATP-binding protein [Candidatus Electrothrix scaldis]|nr:MAG: ATP-binding protein [Candidatus Electrothrix sp. GW3-3]
MKLKLTVTISSLLFIGMLLINIVLLFLWRHHALQDKAKHDQAVLAHIQSLLLRGSVPGENSLTEFIFSNFYDSSENGRFFVLLESGQPEEQERKNNAISSGKHDAIEVLLVSAATEAKTSGRPVSRTAALHPHVLSCNGLLLNARPLVQEGEVIGAVAVIRSLDALFQELWTAEKTVFAYLLVNVLVLGAIGFFRMAGLIIRPVDHLVALADQYTDYDPFRFVPQDSGTEFGRLSNSLNSMLTRIEEDRQTLQHTVQALELANQTLKKQQQEMVRAEKLASVGRMAAGLAHEIGNPLSVVQGYLEMLQSAPGQSETHKDFLRRSGQEVQRIDRLIRQLLDFSRTNKGSPKIFSLHELLCSVLEMVKVQTVFRDIALETDFAADRDQVFADAEQLRQVFVNCLLNSADAIQAKKRDNDKHEGTVLVRTTLQCPVFSEQKMGSVIQLIVRICDNGTGITEEKLPLIFDPFFTSKEPGKGTGLGLSVSRSLVETAGGTMELTSEIGQGSCMLIALPLTPGNGGD